MLTEDNYFNTIQINILLNYRSIFMHFKIFTVC
jgi:hypothetical protein